MKLAVLSCGPKSYSTRRLVEAAKERGHHVRVLNTLKFSIDLQKGAPDLFYRGKLEAMRALISEKARRRRRTKLRPLPQSKEADGDAPKGGDAISLTSVEEARGCETLMADARARRCGVDSVARAFVSRGARGGIDSHGLIG